MLPNMTVSRTPLGRVPAVTVTCFGA